MKTPVSIAIWGLVCILSGCRHAPLAYTLRQEGRTQILTPPVSKPEIKKARVHPAQKVGCDVEAESFSVAWQGNTARVGVKTDTYFTAPPPASNQPQGTPAITVTESAPRIYADSLTALEGFREALAAREDAGCFRDNEGAHLRQAIVEAFPFPPQIAAFLRFGAYTRTGFIDLTPGFVLRLVSPTGAEPDVSFYEVKPANGPVRIFLSSGAGKALAVPEAPAYFRYLYWTGGSTHSFRTTIIGVPQRSMLSDATTQFLASPEEYCAQPGAGISCQSIAVSVGMNAGFYIRVNGKDTFVRLGGPLGEALGESLNGMRLVRGAQPLPQNVTVRRMFHGKLIPVNSPGTSGILGLVAMPGDEITSRP